MKTKLLTFLPAACLLALTAWLVNGQTPAKTDALPEKYRDTVHKGLEFLVKQQHKDGHWEGVGGKHPVAMTALAGIALLMEGSTLDKGNYSGNIRKAANWLMDKSQAGRDGLIFSDHPSETDRYMHGHGLATQFLAWAYRHETDDARQKKLHEVINRAAQYIVKAQSTQGGWYKTSKVEGHDFDSISATAIQIQALYMVRNLGIPVRVETVAGNGQEYLKLALAKLEQGGKPGSAEIAAALACRYCPESFLDSDGTSVKWFKDCRTQIPMDRRIEFGRDEQIHYYYAQAVFNAMINSELSAGIGAVAWSDYRTTLFDQLRATQKTDGSWPAPLEAKGGFGVGTVYSTAVWCTVLQLDRKCHPLTQNRALVTF